MKQVTDLELGRQMTMTSLEILWELSRKFEALGAMLEKQTESGYGFTESWG